MAGAKEHPILFSAPMVRALLANSKFVTRRLSPQWLKVKAGDRLWVRETWQPIRGRTAAEQAQTASVIERFIAGAIPAEQIVEAAMSLPMGSGEQRALYAADYGDWAYAVDSDMRPWKPSIHMPRKFSRILLECEEDTRAERLQDITAEDAIREGIEACCGDSRWRCYGNAPHGAINHYAEPRASFESLWQSLHTKPGERWEGNPTVYRVGRFRRIAG